MAKKPKATREKTLKERAETASCPTPKTTKGHYATLERLIGTSQMSSFTAALRAEFFEDEDEEETIPDRDDVVAVFAQYLERHVELFDRMASALVRVNDVYEGEEPLAEELQDEVLALSTMFETDVAKAKLGELYVKEDELYHTKQALDAIRVRYSDIPSSGQLHTEMVELNKTIGKLEKRFPQLKRPVNERDIDE